MDSIDEADAQARLDEILDEVQQHPITIRREGAEVVVMLSMATYEQIRLAAVREFLVIRDDVAREASASGVTQDRLNELLDPEEPNDES